MTYNSRIEWNGSGVIIITNFQTLPDTIFFLIMSNVKVNRGCAAPIYTTTLLFVLNVSGHEQCATPLLGSVDETVSRGPRGIASPNQLNHVRIDTGPCITTN